jgi:hypothetical protein
VHSYLSENGLLSICSLPFSMSVQALRKVEEQLFGILKNHLFWFLYYFKIRGSPVLVLWQHIRMKELLGPGYFKSLKEHMVFMKELAMNWWIYGWLLESLIKKEIHAYYTPELGIWFRQEPCLWIIRTALIFMGGVFPVSNNCPTPLKSMSTHSRCSLYFRWSIAATKHKDVVKLLQQSWRAP